MKKSRINVLIVEDDPTHGKAMQEAFERAGYNVTLCTSSTWGLQTAQRQEFHCLVVDCMLPKMNGVELIGRLRKLHPATAVILISGFTDTLGLDEANTGADVVLQKSNNEVPQLIRAVNRLLRKQQAPPKKAAGSQAGSKAERRKTR